MGQECVPERTRPITTAIWREIALFRLERQRVAIRVFASCEKRSSSLMARNMSWSSQEVVLNIDGNGLRIMMFPCMTAHLEKLC